MTQLPSLLNSPFMANDTRVYTVKSMVNLLIGKRDETVTQEVLEKFRNALLEKEAADSEWKGIVNLFDIACENKYNKTFVSISWGPNATLQDAIKSYASILDVDPSERKGEPLDFGDSNWLERGKPIDLDF